jgi:hypothetical protein
MKIVVGRGRCRDKFNMSSRLGKLEREPWRALLARTAEGGCPHMVIGDYQLITAIRNCLPTLSVRGNLIGDGAICVK